MNNSVLMVFSDLGLGGVQTKMISLANELVRRGIFCRILIQSKNGFYRLEELDRKVKVTCPLDMELFGKHPFWGWRFGVFVAIVSLLLRQQSMVVSLAPLSVTLLKIYAFIAPWMLSRVVVNEDTYPSLYYSGGHVHGATHADIRTWYKKAQAVIAVSKSTYADLSRVFKIPSPPLVYIPNWALSDNQKRSRRRPDRAIDVVYAGRFAKQKQPMVLARVLSEIVKTRPKTNIHIYADGPMKSEFIGELVRLKMKQKVRLYNPIARMEHILRNTKCLLITSQFEGMPFIGLEAMACGAVMAGFDVPGVRDIVKDGETGVLAQNQEELSDHVIKLLNHTKIREDLARNARKRAESEFSENNRDTLIDLLLEHKI